VSSSSKPEETALVIHESVREAVAGFLRSTNPTRYRDYRRAAWRELREAIREAAPSELWRYTADILYLIDEVALGLRRRLDAERGEAPGEVQAAAWLDVKHTYMALRPALRRIYVVVRDVPTYWPIVERLGFRPLTDKPAVMDGVEYSTVVLDSVPTRWADGWCACLPPSWVSATNLRSTPMRENLWWTGSASS
jgi:hypothetical protein